MPNAASSQDWNNFCTAASQSQFGGKVGISRAIQVRLRDWAVENGILQAGQVAPVEAYAAFIGQFLAANVSLEKEKSAEEIAQEAADAKLAEDRRNAGRLFTKDEATNPVRDLTAEYVKRDPIVEHNTAQEARLNAARNPVAERMQQMENVVARMSPTAIPGTVDESYGANVVTMSSGKISHYQTQLAIAAAKEKNVQARAKFAEQQAQAAAQAAANPKQGI